VRTRLSKTSRLRSGRPAQQPRGYIWIELFLRGEWLCQGTCSARPCMVKPCQTTIRCRFVVGVKELQPRPHLSHPRNGYYLILLDYLVSPRPWRFSFIPFNPAGSRSPTVTDVSSFIQHNWSNKSLRAIASLQSTDRTASVSNPVHTHPNGPTPQ